MNYSTLKILRRLYILFCVVLGVISPLVCSYYFPDFDPREQPLSTFAMDSITSDIWFISLVLISIGLIFNGEVKIDTLIRVERFKLPLRICLWVSSICLFLLAAFDMTYGNYHNLFAVGFFLCYNFFVFCFGLVRSLTYVRRGMFSVMMGSLMLLSSLLLIPYPSYGISEIVFIVLVCIWNWVMLYRVPSKV